LVIDYNLFERVYIRKGPNKFALTSNTTKVCDVSRTTIYRANSLIIYARMNELDFIAYIANQYCWWSFLHILKYAKQHARMKSMKGTCLRIKPKHKT
jgi:hypothetical protein